MTLQNAIEMLRNVKNVKQWNETREIIKSQVSTKDWFNHYMPAIDGSGLIVQILGTDN